MMKSQKIKQIHDILASGENAQKLTMHDLEFYRDHFDDLARELNVSGREFRPAFEYANKQYLRVVDIIRARLERQENKKSWRF